MNRVKSQNLLKQTRVGKKESRQSFQETNKAYNFTNTRNHFVEAVIVCIHLIVQMKLSEIETR